MYCCKQTRLYFVWQLVKDSSVERNHFSVFLGNKVDSVESIYVYLLVIPKLGNTRVTKSTHRWRETFYTTQLGFMLFTSGVPN